jgi:hypothetical protein
MFCCHCSRQTWCTVVGTLDLGAFIEEPRSTCQQEQTIIRPVLEYDSVRLSVHPLTILCISLVYEK